eukprot:TRINITY_DN14749_c0_g1_i1.p1 TRINITY_DN14749_c0_g1~~TRINITY_DN14749_c0_g1_i1.p1  ORF type:complete len:345 (+),score=61.07 TRINITY_DN14749_c0_g1_i1:516-1550(+)
MSPDRLEIRGNITAKKIEALADMLTHNTSLLSLFLQFVVLKDKGTQLLAAAVQKNSKLHNLEMSYCDIGAEGATEIAKMLPNNSSLRRLIFNGNAFMSDVDTVAMGVKHNQKPKYLSWNRVIYDRSVHSLSFQTVRFIKDDTTAFSKLVQTLDTITTVNLEDIYLDKAGRKTMIESLKQSKHLRTLNLTKTGTDDKDVDSVVDLLLSNPALVELKLKGNYLSNEGAKKLSKALTNLHNLRLLDLSDNCLLQFEGKNALRMELRNNPFVSLIYYGNNCQLIKQMELVWLCCRELVRNLSLLELQSILIPELFHTCANIAPFCLVFGRYELKYEWKYWKDEWVQKK